MALLRLMVVALAACNSADAQTPPPSAATTPAPITLTPPPGWTTLPAMAKAVRDAATADGGRVTATDAWGDTARGCYAVLVQLAGMNATTEAILEGITGVTTTDLVRPEQGGGVLSLRFTQGEYTGRLRTRSSQVGVTALACFANQREPAGCAAACDQVLGALR